MTATRTTRAGREESAGKKTSRRGRQATKEMRESAPSTEKRKWRDDKKTRNNIKMTVLLTRSPMLSFFSFVTHSTEGDIFLVDRSPHLLDPTYATTISRHFYGLIPPPLLHSCRISVSLTRSLGLQTKISSDPWEENLPRSSTLTKRQRRRASF